MPFAAQVYVPEEEPEADSVAEFPTHIPVAPALEDKVSEGVKVK